MGGLFSKCQKKKEVPNSRVDNVDQMRIDLQSRKRQANDYLKRLTIKAEDAQKSAVAYMKAKNKSRALMALKLKKMYEANVEKANGMINILTKSMQDLDGAQINSDVYNVLKEGDNMIKEMQSKVKIEDLEQIKENTEEAMQMSNEISEFMSANKLDDANFLNELDNIESMQIIAEINSPEMAVPINKVNEPSKPVTLEAQPSEEKVLLSS